MMKLKARNIDLTTDFSHYSDRQRLACEQLQTKARELLTQDAGLSGPLRKRYEDRHPDVLLNAAADQLGNTDERYSGIYACESCGRLYNADYAENSDPGHDYCSATCQPERSHKKYDV